MCKRADANKKRREERYAAGLCVMCAQPHDSRNPAGNLWRQCPKCRNEQKLEARATKDILYPPIPPKLFTAADWKPSPAVIRMIDDRDRSQQLWGRINRKLEALGFDE